MTDYRPSMTLELAHQKAQMIYDIRHFFYQKGVLEITTPILCRYGNTDVFIQSVHACFHKNGTPSTGYLHTSPEFAMKRVLADYQCPLYQICQVFRDDEKGHRHNIEFSMLEWYRPHFGLDELADELQQLITVALGSSLPFRRYRYTQAFMDKLGVHPFAADIPALRQTALDHHITLDIGEDRQGWLDLLFSHLIEPHLGFDTPTLITDYPVATAALAKVAQDEDGYAVARRFELYINGIEIANAYDELADSAELMRRFDHDNQQRLALGMMPMPIDWHLIHACDDLPPCSGIALGLDRLFMIRAGLDDISQALLFVSDRA